MQREGKILLRNIAQPASHSFLYEINAKSSLQNVLLKNNMYILSVSKRIGYKLSSLHSIYTFENEKMLLQEEGFSTEEKTEIY